MISPIWKNNKWTICTSINNHIPCYHPISLFSLGYKHFLHSLIFFPYWRFLFSPLQSLFLEYTRDQSWMFALLYLYSFSWWSHPVLFFFQFFGSQLKSNKLHVFHTTDLKSDQAFTWSYHQHNLDNKCFYPPSKISLLPLVIFHF